VIHAVTLAGHFSWQFPVRCPRGLGLMTLSEPPALMLFQAQGSKRSGVVSTGYEAKTSLICA